MKSKAQKYAWVHRFPFAGHEVFLGGKNPDGGLPTLVNQFVDQGNTGQAQLALLFSALAAVKVDGGDYAEWYPRTDADAPEFPLLIAEDGTDTLGEFVLRYLVRERFPWTAVKWPQAFKEFLPDEEEPTDEELFQQEQVAQPGFDTNPTVSAPQV